MSYEIILVDNASDEVNPERFLELFPKIKLIKNSQNVGFGVANNIGVENSIGEFVLLLNSDAYLLNDAIDVALVYAYRFPSVKVFGANVLNSDRTPQKSFYLRKGTGLKAAFLSGFIYENPVLLRVFKFKNHSNEIGGLYGAYVFIERKTYLESKGFDPDFFMYCEDIEWFRNRMAGEKISICTEAVVVHDGEGSSMPNKLNPNKILSYFLYWYKLGKFQYFVYSLGAYTSTLFTFFLIWFMSNNERAKNLKIASLRFKFFKVIISEIPRYSNKYGSRPSPLRVN